MKPRVLLLHSFLTCFEDDPTGISPVLGLAYLAGYLEKKKIPVRILDIAAEGAGQERKIGRKIRRGLSVAEIKKRIKKFNPQIVGITCISTPHAPDAHELADIVKKVNPKILVVMGGAYPSSDPRGALQNKNVDLVVRGEGELTMTEIVSRFQKGESLENIPGTLFKKGRKVVENLPRQQIADIDTLPFPARHLLPMDIYLKEVLKNDYLMRNRPTTVASSRGCPGDCIYCSVKVIWGRRWRGRSPKNVVDEIEFLMKEYGINEIHFLDDSISVDMKRLEKICDLIIKRKLDVKWTTPNGIALWLLNEKLISKMKQAGCYRLTFGLESGNERVLKQFIRKNYDYARAKEIITYAGDIGLWTVGTFILGFPEEKREEVEDTIKFAISTDLDFAVFYIANPRKGTEMYEIYKKLKLLPSRGDHYIIRGTKTKHFTHDQLKTLQAEAFSRFLKSRLKKPWRFFLKIRSLEDTVYAVKLGRNYLKIITSQAVIKTRGIVALHR